MQISKLRLQLSPKNGGGQRHFPDSQTEFPWQSLLFVQNFSEKHLVKASP